MWKLTLLLIKELVFTFITIVPFVCLTRSWFMTILVMLLLVLIHSWIAFCTWCVIASESDLKYSSLIHIYNITMKIKYIDAPSLKFNFIYVIKDTRLCWHYILTILCTHILKHIQERLYWFKRFILYALQIFYG
jgi:hypothetical protein